MEDKSTKSRRGGLDRCGETNINNKKHNTELCYADSFAMARSTNSPGFHRKGIHFGHQADKDSRSDDYQPSNTAHSRNRDQKQKEHKAEVHRLAEFVCGDWSEHISSSGKRYYYNCKTEVSQWEKPKEWNDVLVVPPGVHSDASQQHSLTEPVTNLPEDDMRSKMLACSEESTPSTEQSNYQKGKGNPYSALQSALNTTNIAKLPVDNSYDNCRREGEIKHVANSVKTSSVAEDCSSENCHWSEAESRLPVCVSGIYGLLSSSRENTAAHQHNGSKNSQEKNRADEDMDISPGSTPTEESLLEKRLNVIYSTADLAKSVTSALSPVTSQPTEDHLDDPCLCDVSATTNSSSANSTFLSTLTSLQQALHHVTPTGDSGATKSVPSSALNLLASLPSLVNQLQEAERGPAAATTSSQCQQSDQQHIMQQVIHMLQRLQQALVAQQQQQQQRQLQELLLQLLSMQKHGNNSSVSGTSLPLCHQHSAYKSTTTETSCGNATKFESPYSPPDSDGTPLGSPENQCYTGRESAVLSSDMLKSSESPKSNDHGCSATLLKQSVNSPDRNITVSSSVAAGSSSVLVVIPGAVQSTALVGTSHLAAGVLRKQHDSIGLTPTLANYVNNRLIDHITGWQTDVMERQVNCYSEESNSCSSLQCTQISVDLKQARSLVRLNEIQTTLQEQRVMFIRQQTKDLESMRSGYMFQTNVHSVDT